jgi:hypothetical protein
LDSICTWVAFWCIYIQEVHEMTDKPCECNVKEYDGKYRCMICFKEFVLATEEDVMNMTQVAPALERIHELETENTVLQQTIAAMKTIMDAARNPGNHRATIGGMLKDRDTGEVTHPVSESLHDVDGLKP